MTHKQFTALAVTAGLKAEIHPVDGTIRISGPGLAAPVKIRTNQPVAPGLVRTVQKIKATRPA